MKLFSDNYFITFNKPGFIIFLTGIMLQSCATHHAQFGKDVKKPVIINATDSLQIAHTFFLIGDAGNTNEKTKQQKLGSLEERLKKASKNTTLLFLGDNIYPKGLPAAENTNERLLAESKLTNQLKLSKNFKGQTIFIPGNHDWYSGIKGLERQAKFVTEYLNDKKSFLPRKSCGIDDLEINNNLVLITIDSQWFLEDWDNSPTINDDCTIKTREAFFAELENLLIKNQEKAIVLALHHPLMSNGSHGGQFSVMKQLFPLEQKIPLPVLGSVANFFRKTSGVSLTDIQNKQYTLFIKRLKTLLQSQDNVIVVSGHDHNLQYIEKENIKQIISGAGSKSEAAKAIYPNDFSYGRSGYATLAVYENGAAKVSFFGEENNKEKLIHEHMVLNEKDDLNTKVFSTTFPKTITSSIYTIKQTKKSGFYRFLFGNHFRTYYSLPINATTTTIDTLYGGLQPKRSGGGYHSNTLQLFDKKGREFVMRAMKKNTSSFLQTVAFKNQFIQDEFENTYAEDLLSDFYTTSHPYTPFAVGNLAGKIGVAHTNPSLYYIPKHRALKNFNADFGDELYLIEERPTDSQIGVKSFGTPISIISTEDVMKNLHKDEKYSVDESAYIKARLFDMLIGDWDRHKDQWRWGEYKVGEKVIYKPIPRDRDQAFPKYDGALLFVLMKKAELRHMQSFKEKISNVKLMNREPYPLDLAFIKNADENEWVKQAKYIQENLSDITIDAAFSNLPKEVQDETISDIKRKLKLRRNQLHRSASVYHSVLQHTVLIVGTDKKDKFVIQNNEKNKLEIHVYRVTKETEELQYSKSFTAKKTKKIWIYGLDEDDIFEVKGNSKSNINIRLIGGQNEDSYTVENGRKIKIHDFKTKKNTYNLDSKSKVLLSDDYEMSLYNYQKPKYNSFSALPNIGFNPDDGIKLGVVTGYVVNDFKQNPYTQKHSLKANYFFATKGYELIYSSNIPKLFSKWNLDFEGQFTSPNFTINYFGYGNETVNNDDTFGMDFNRVRIKMLKIMPSIKKVGKSGNIIHFQTSFERITVEETINRFVDISTNINPSVFENQQFAGASLKYSFENYDVPSFPTMGMGFSIAGTWKMNLVDTNRNFPIIESKLNFNHKIDANGKLVLATILRGKMILNNNFDFYQGANLGGDYNLRGFRNQRFLGNQSFYQSSDIRWNFGKIKRSIIPMSYGILAGFDYGRVWLKGENSEKWHQSFGGGLWINGLNALTARLTYFKSAGEETRIAFGLGFGF
ncbi:metallophosphoesterase [Flavobacterium glaciei]|uniref:Calcineurin-like phosphoesterase family protein n=1 Tax=Flavobacterium glaciei TaxID=386300 RepID=A0A562Q1T5_9FLAO|nr:metallophosphoesterase [Flavobacterium glaciei]RDI57561.1 calcineurin-like phosphoesterase family protein [Flavobacterium glaciei]TWI50639.1 calcineurin-like phosphoesterase family protein [Flavobacterium glaciei]